MGKGSRNRRARAAVADQLFARPPESVFNTEGCPVDSRCAGCGASEGLGVMVSAFSGGESACVTVCGDCDGRSMIHLVGFAGMDQRVAAHRSHRATG